MRNLIACICNLAPDIWDRSKSGPYSIIFKITSIQEIYLSNNHNNCTLNENVRVRKDIHCGSFHYWFHVVYQEVYSHSSQVDGGISVQSMTHLNRSLVSLLVQGQAWAPHSKPICLTQIFNSAVTKKCQDRFFSRQLFGSINYTKLSVSEK